MKQKSSDRNLISEKSSNLEKNRSRKLSNSSQNLQGDLQTVKKPQQQQQRNSLYAKNSKHNRSNTEELLTLQSNEIIREISPSREMNTNGNSDTLLATKIKNIIQIEDESLWNEFYNNINDLVLLGQFQKEV